MKSYRPTRGRVLMIKTPHTRSASPHSTLEYNIDRKYLQENLQKYCRLTSHPGLFDSVAIEGFLSHAYFVYLFKLTYCKMFSSVSQRIIGALHIKRNEVFYLCYEKFKMIQRSRFSLKHNSNASCVEKFK